MNEQKLTKYLASYKEWLTKNPSAANVRISFTPMGHGDVGQ